MIFREKDCGAVPILAEGKPVAILTDRDVALALSEFPDLVSRPVSEIMTPGIVAVAPDDSLEQVCEVLRDQAVRRVWSSIPPDSCWASSVGPISRPSCQNE